MSYTHFTIEERCCLREFYKKGYSYRKIAKLLGRNVSSASRRTVEYAPLSRQSRQLSRRASLIASLREVAKRNRGY